MKVVDIESVKHLIEEEGIETDVVGWTVEDWIGYLIEEGVITKDVFEL